MTDFLLELLSEEIPARMQKKARADLERLFIGQMDEAGLKAGDITVYSTPRRLALIAKSLPEQTEAVREEAKGPPEGAPDQAVDGFCRKNGVMRDQLEIRDVKGRATYFAVINKPGRDTKNVLADVIPAIIKAFPWPKSMRWGDASESTESLRWVRPLSGIVAIFGNDLVECEIDGMASGVETAGHRFHHANEKTVDAEPVEARPPDERPSTSSGLAGITIGNAADYAAKLRAAHVLVDHDEREAIIRDGAVKAASDAGLALVEDEGLIVENAGLTEWPVPLLGSFDPAFLDVPEEVIQLTARVNQKYFICRDKKGNLSPNFICTANIDASDGGKAIVAGNEKVLAARLADAKFFWELDQKTTLEEQAKKLSNIVFHEKLGTVADKVERVARLAEWLVSLEGTGLHRADPEQTKQAARLCKADLVTEMVGEFPELQGLMGGYYAEKEGLAPEVAAAIRDHYKPVGQGDDVPTDPVTVAVSLADKLDMLGSFFIIGEQPTGSKDPYALRRAALSVIRLVVGNNLRLNLGEPLSDHMLGVKTHAAVMHSPAVNDLKLFISDRIKVQQRDAGVRHDLVEAVSDSGREDDLVRLLARVKALQAFVETVEGANLLAGYKRASNILKKSSAPGVDPEPREAERDVALGSASSAEHKEGGAEKFVRVERSRDTGPEEQGLSTSLETNGELGFDPEPAEAALISALNAAEPKAAAAIEAEDFEGAMAALASLRGPIDVFFENVKVNDDDPAKRAARLALLARVRDAVHQVADFSKIEG